MIDWRVTPSRPASLSKDSIIQVGKSTFTRFCSWRGRRAFERSKASVMSLPLSNSESNFLAFIDCYLLYSRATNRDYSDVVVSRGYYSGPMLLAYTPDNKKPRLIQCFCWYFNEIRVIPKSLGRVKVYAMLIKVGLTLFVIVFEISHGIKNIPLWMQTQGVGLCLNAALCGKFGAQRKICPAAAHCYAFPLLRGCQD